MECPDLYNPADFFLCQLNGGSKETGAICGKFGESGQGKALASELEDIRRAAIKNEFIYGVRDETHSKLLECIRNYRLCNIPETFMYSKGYTSLLRIFCVFN